MTRSVSLYPCFLLVAIRMSSFVLEKSKDYGKATDQRVTEQGKQWQDMAGDRGGKREYDLGA